MAQRSRPRSGRCALLAEAEVRSAIGPHDGGQSGVGDWRNMGCRWAADRVQDISGLPPWRDAIDVAQFDAARTEWAREQATGRAVPGFVNGALYDESSGDLWFPCAGNRVCVVKVRTASSDGREESAIRLARLVNERV